MDLKDRYQQKADEIAESRYGAEFYDLPEDTQLEVYEEAMRLVADDLAAEGDALRDRLLERQG